MFHLFNDNVSQKQLHRLHTRKVFHVSSGKNALWKLFKYDINMKVCYILKTYIIKVICIK